MGKLYMDLETGETLTEEQVAKRAEENQDLRKSRFSWSRAYPSDADIISRVVDYAPYSVVHEIIYHRNLDTNEYVGTHDDIAKRTGVSIPTVARTMKRVQDGDLVRSRIKSHYMINPNIFVAGSDSKVERLQERYAQLDKPKKIISSKRKPVKIEPAKTNLQEKINKIVERSKKGVSEE